MLFYMMYVDDFLL
jgi:hypothetical protein